MNKMTCIIVEDEPLARKSLEKLCSTKDNIALKGTFENGQSALSFLKDNPVDLLFLDIEMPDMMGWELLDSLPYIPMVIVISANKEYAFDAFQYKVADFIQKPVSSNLLDAALQKVEVQAQSRVQLQNNNEIYIKSNGKLFRIELFKILYIENLADYVKIFTTETNHVIYCTMKHLEMRLPSSQFLKVHRSYIINLNRIEYVEDNDIFIAGKLIPIARSQKADFLDRLNLL